MQRVHFAVAIFMQLVLKHHRSNATAGGDPSSCNAPQLLVNSVMHAIDSCLFTHQFQTGGS